MHAEISLSPDVHIPRYNLDTRAQTNIILGDTIPQIQPLTISTPLGEFTSPSFPTSNTLQITKGTVTKHSNRVEIYLEQWDFRHSLASPKRPKISSPMKPSPQLSYSGNNKEIISEELSRKWYTEQYRK